MAKATDNLKSILGRTTLRTSRLLDFASEKELVAQTGHQRSAWPLVVLKELVDNAIDTCEEAGVAPVVFIKVDDEGITSFRKPISSISNTQPSSPTAAFGRASSGQERISPAFVVLCRGIDLGPTPHERMRKEALAF
jgi:hypothetical protein